MSQHAKRVKAQYKLTKTQLFDFLVFLVNLNHTYHQAGLVELAHAAKSDISGMVAFIEGIIGNDWEATSNELQKRNYSFWIIRDFRNLNETLRLRDRSQEAFTSALKQSSPDLAPLGLAETDIAQLLRFCEKNDITTMLYAASNLESTELEKIFLPINRYSTLKELCGALEYFLKAIVKRKQAHVQVMGKPKPTEGVTLSPLIRALFKNEGWLSDFEYQSDTQKVVQASNLSAFQTNFQTIRNNTQGWATHFLIANLARNFPTHHPIIGDWLYEDIFGASISSVVHAILYSWYLAKRDSWV